MKYVKRILSVLLCLPLLLVCGVPAAAAEGTQLQFSKEGKLKIAVFSDVQSTQFVSGTMMDCLNAVLDTESPDLVVFLGDQIEGKSPYIHIGDSEAHVKQVIKTVVAPVVERNIPFAVVFGNHDGQDSGVSKETQMAYYRSFPGCLAEDEGDALPGCGTYHLMVASSDGKRTALNLYFIDSLEYDSKGGYGCVSKEQIAWCRSVGDTLAKANGGMVPALAFQHIIVPEIYNTFTQVRQGEEGAFRGQGIGKNNWYVAPAGMDGVMEAPCPPEYSNGQFSAWRDVGDVKAAFFGHDHVNSFTARLDSIDLVACPGATYASYNNDSARGVRIIEIDEKTIAEGKYDTHIIHFTDLYPSGPIAAVKRFFQPSRQWDFTLLGVIVVLIIGNAVFWPLFVRRRKKKKAAAKEMAAAVPKEAEKETETTKQ